MSAVIDKRVVEMSFDNSNFEKNVSQSMSTLDKLKKALHFDGVGKGLENVNQAAKAIDISGLTAGVEALQRRFSVLGEIGHNALSNITNNMIGLSTSFLRFVADGIKSGGISRAMNLEKANFQLQGLLKDNEQVAAIMQNVSDSVDGTAYSLDAAAMAASMFAATGMRAGDEMYAALRGVAGVAAMTSSEYTEISRIFTTVAGQGRVMGDQLNQLAARGLNAASTLAAYMNKMGITANATEADIRKMVSDGVISFELFSAAMDDAFGEHAKKANETFTGSMANIRSALARIGADFVAPLVKQGGSLVQLFNALRIKVNEVRKQTTPFATEAALNLETIITKVAKLVETFQVPDLTNGFQIIKNLVTSIKNVFKGLESIIRPIRGAFRDVFPEGLPNIILSISEALVKLTRHLRLNKEQADGVRGAFTALFTALKWVGTALSTVINAGFKVLSPLISTASGYISKLTSIIGKHVGSLFKWIDSLDLMTNGLTYAQKIFEVVSTAVKKFVDAFLSIPLVQKIIAGLKEALGEFYDAGSKAFTDLGNVFTTFISKLKDIKNLKFEDVIEFFVGIKDAIVDNFGPIVSKIIDGFVTAITNARDGVKAGVKGIGSAFTWLKENLAEAILFIKGLFEDVPLDQFVVIGIGAALVYFLKHLNDLVGRALSLLSGGIGGINSLISAINQVLYGLTDIERSINSRIKAETFYTIAKSIALLAASLIALSLVPADNLIKAGIALGGLGAGLVILSAAFGAINKYLGGSGAGLKGVGTAFLGLAASLAIIVRVIEKLNGMDIDKVGISLLELGVMLTGLVAAVGLLGRLDKDVHKNALAMLAMAGSLKILVSALDSLTKIDPGKATANLGSLTVLLTMTAALLLASSNADWGSAASLLAAGVAIRLMVSTVKAINKIDDRDMAKGIMVVGAFEILLTALMVATRITGNYGKSAGASMLAFSASILIMSMGIKSLAKISDVDLARGLAVTAGLSLIFTAVVALSRIAGKNGKQAAITMFAFSGAMMVMSVALRWMSKIDPDGLMRATAAVSIIGIVMAGIVATSHLAKDCSKTLIVIASVMAGLALVVAGLSFIDPDRLMNATLAMSLLMGAFAVVVSSTALAKKANSTIIILASVVAVLGGVLTLMSAFDTQNALMNALALSTLLLALSASMLIISNINKVSMAAIAGMYMLSGVVAILATVLGVLSALNVEPSMESALALSTLLLTLTGIVTLFSIGPFGPQALAGVLIGTLALIEFIAIMGAAMVGLGALFQNVAGLEGMLDTGISILNKIGEGIGGFIGSFLGGIIESFLSTVGNGLVAFADQLNLFVEKIAPAMEGLKGLPEGSFDRVADIVAIIIALSAAEVVAGIAAILPFSASMEDLGQTLLDFAGIMKDFGAKLEEVEIDDDKVETVKKCAEMMSELQTMMVGTGGALQAIMGEKLDLGVFGERVKTFIDAMKEASNSLKGVEIEETAIETMKKLGELFSALQKDLPREGGALQDFLGANLNLGVFGVRIKNYIDNMIKVSDSLKDVEIEESAVTTMANLGKLFSELQNSLPTEGGRLQEFLGSTMDLGKFGEKIGQYIDDMILVSMKLSLFPINETAIESAVNMGELLSGLQNSLPTVNGTLQAWFTGEQMDLGTFGENIEKLATSITAASKKASALKPAAVTNLVFAAGELKTLFDVLPDDEDWFDGVMGIDEFGRHLATFSGNMKTFSLNTADYDTSNVSTMVQNITDLTAAITSLSEIDVTSVTSFMGDFGNQLIQSFVDSLNVSSNNMDIAIVTFMTGIVAIVNGNTHLVTSAFTALFDEVKDILDTSARRFKSSGEALSQEFVNGFTEAFTTNSSLGTTIVGAISTSITSAGTSMTAAGQALVTALNNGMILRGSEISRSALSIITAALLQITSKQPNFMSAGNVLMVSMNAGILQGSVIVTNSVNLLIETMLTTLRTAAPSFLASGQELMTSLESGVESKTSDVSNTIKRLVDIMVLSVRNGYDDMYNAAYYLLEGFVRGINQNRWKVEEAARNVALTAKNSIESTLKIASPSKVGEEDGGYFVLGFVKGIVGGLSNVETTSEMLASAFVVVLEQALLKVEDQYAFFSMIGEELMSRLIVGIDNKSYDAVAVVKKMAENMRSSLGTYKIYFYNIGMDYVKGFVQGIINNIYLAVSAAQRLANEVMAAARNALMISSPSKESEKDGGYYVVGFANGILKNIYKAREASSKFADTVLVAFRESMEAISDIMDSGFDISPTITPVLDFTKLQKDANKIDTILSSTKASTISAAMNRMNGVEPSDQAIKAVDTAPSYNFVQNNYSPKALSRLEIYRQSKNMFNMARMVGSK